MLEHAATRSLDCRDLLINSQELSAPAKRLESVESQFRWNAARSNLALCIDAACVAGICGDNIAFSKEKASIYVRLFPSLLRKRQISIYFFTRKNK
jgi:hypothetical protein